MKNIFSTSLIIAGLFFLLSNFIQSQIDPFRINETGPRTVNSQDIFINWVEDIGGGHYKNFQKVYRYKVEGILMPLDSLNIDTLFTKTEKREDSRQVYYEQMDVASGRFNNTPYDNTVSIWTSPNTFQKIDILISNFDTTGLFTDPISDSLDAGESIDMNFEIYVRTGDFDADSLDEFIIAYLDDLDSIIICSYDMDSTLQVTQITRFSNIKTLGGSLPGEDVQFYIQTADLNGDDKDEIVLFKREITTSSNIPVSVYVYAFENSNIVPKGNITIQVPNPGIIVQDFLISAAKGQFDNDVSDELLFATHVKCTNLTYYRWAAYNYILKASQDLQTITVGPRLENNNSSPNYLKKSFCTAVGDLNANHKDEVVIVSEGFCKVYTVNDDYSLQYKSQMSIPYTGNNDYRQSKNFLQVCDLNMDNKKDIVITRYINVGSDIGFWIEAFAFTDSTLHQAKSIARMKGDEPLAGYGKFAIGIGNFDGFDFTVGTPTLHHAYGIVQPIVLLNAPPVHFDVFNGTTYDVNGCYNGGSCDFWAQYYKQTTTSVEVSTEIHNDWDLSAGYKTEGSVSAGFLGFGVSSNYKAWAIGNYGEHFSKDSSNSSTISISVEVQAREDDRIYSTISDYDVWEYPIFHGNESFSRRSYFALVPKNVQATWYGSKSYFAQHYVPDHEVGNILSYYPYDTLSLNPNLSEVIRASYVSDRFSLDGSSSYTWNLTFTDFQQSGASTERNAGFDAGVEMGGIATNFKFSNNKMTTHKTSVENIIDLKVHLGSVNMGLGDVKYAVTPYAYWEKNGALVIDYAVKPELSPPGFPPTWWQDNYGNQPDPSFALPWRLDPEKGFAIGDPAKRFQTKDITFIPRKPSVGDTLTITARVRNFSFMSTSSPVSVSFYFSDPDSGGTPIIGVNGTNSITTGGIISPQGRIDVNFKCVIPNGLPSYPRIYAVIDQVNAIAEIHENNNKGFNVLGANPVSGYDDENYILPNKYMLYQSFPNPFNPSTTIKYSVQISDIVSIKVYDLLGREVATLMNEYKTAGTYSIEFDGSKFASGVYFYQLRTGEFVQTRKMVLLK